MDTYNQLFLTSMHFNQHKTQVSSSKRKHRYFSKPCQLVVNKLSRRKAAKLTSQESGHEFNHEKALANANPEAK